MVHVECLLDGMSTLMRSLMKAICSVGTRCSSWIGLGSRSEPEPATAPLKHTRDEIEQLLVDGIKALTSPLRKVLLGRLIQARSFGDLAHDLRISPRQVQKRAIRALHTLHN